MPDNDRAQKTEFVLERAAPSGEPAEPLTLHIGDHILLHNTENPAQPRIGIVETLWSTRSGGRVVTYSVYLRPQDTFHLPTRHFYANEVLRTSELASQPLEDVLRKCCIHYIRDYLRLVPVGIDERDHFLCESKYVPKSKTIKLIKTW